MSGAGPGLRPRGVHMDGDQDLRGPQVNKFEEVYSGHIGTPCEQTDTYMTEITTFSQLGGRV